MGVRKMHDKCDFCGLTRDEFIKKYHAHYGFSNIPYAQMKIGDLRAVDHAWNMSFCHQLEKYTCAPCCGTACGHEIDCYRWKPVLVEQNGEELIFKRLIKESDIEKVLDYKLRNVVATKDGSCAVVALYVNDELRHKDKLLLCRANDRTKFVNKSALAVCETDLMYIDDYLRYNLPQPTRAKAGSGQQTTNGEQSDEQLKEESLNFLKDPRLLYNVLQLIKKLGVAGEEKNALLLYLQGTSRLLAEPFHTMIKSESSSGKNYLISKVSQLFPPESIKQFSYVTSKALFHAAPTSDLKHRWLQIIELAGTEEAEYSIRVMESEGDLRLAISVRDPETNEWFMEERVVEGPVAMTTTTTKPKVTIDNETRVLSMFLDESTQQTKRTFKVATAKYKPDSCPPDPEAIAIAQNAQRLLENVRVIIPYADILAESFPATLIRARRDFPRFLALIEVSAFIHQYQRLVFEKNGVKHIVATLADYYIAKLAEENFARSMNQLPPNSERILERMTEYCASKTANEKNEDAMYEIEFTRKDIKQQTGFNIMAVKRYVEPLENTFFEVVEGGQGKTYLYRLTKETPTPLRLPEPRELLETLTKDGKLPNFKTLTDMGVKVTTDGKTPNFNTLTGMGVKVAIDGKTPNFNTLTEGCGNIVHTISQGLYDPLTGEEVDPWAERVYTPIPARKSVKVLKSAHLSTEKHFNSADVKVVLKLDRDEIAGSQTLDENTKAHLQNYLLSHRGIPKRFFVEDLLKQYPNLDRMCLEEFYETAKSSEISPPNDQKMVLDEAKIRLVFDTLREEYETTWKDAGFVQIIPLQVAVARKGFDKYDEIDAIVEHLLDKELIEEVPNPRAGKCYRPAVGTTRASEGERGVAQRARPDGAWRTSERGVGT
jgi:hypothetical protein